MKKITLILFSLLIFFLVSCDNEPPKEPGNLYNIKYEKNGGEFILAPFTKARKGTYISIPEIRKTGYTLDSWKGAEQASDGSWGFTMKEYDVSLKAIWNASNYPITYDLNGGEWVTTPPEDTAQTDSDVYLDEKPKLAGFHFVKWTSDDVKLDLTKFGYHFKMPSHSVSLKAEYSADRYGISYVLDGGDFAEQWYPESAYKDEEVFIVASPEKAGYVFAGWESDDVEIKKDDDIYSFIMPHKNIELKAKWEANLIELKWFEIGDISVARQAYTDQVITLPTGLTKDNYDFVGWRVVPDTVSEDGTTFTVRQIDEKNKYMTIEALWEGKKYNIQYNIGEGAVWKEPPKTEGKLFSEVIIPELNKEGVVVTGWNSSDPNDDIQKLPSEDVNAYRLFRVSGDDITLTPVYELEINYNFVHDNVKILEGYTKTTIPNSIIRLPRCACEGYRFLGWKYSETGIEVAERDGGGWYIPVGNKSVSVEAVWQKVNTIKFYDGDNLLASFEVEDGDNIKMLYPDPSRWPKGSKFMSWYNMDAGKGNYIKAFENYIPSTSVSFKAVWGYPIGGALMYDDPEARDENIVYSFFKSDGTWQNYEPGMIHTIGFTPDYYSVELKNGATITKDRFYVYRPGWERTDATWTYSVDGKFQFPITGANKTEIGGGKYNTQLVLGLIKEGEEAKRGIANINTSSPYTQPDPQGKGDNYTIWSCLQVLNKTNKCNDWYIPSPEEARLIKEYQGSSMPIWTSAEARDQPQNSVFVARFDTDVKKSWIDSWSKVNLGHVMIDYMRSF